MLRVTTRRSFIFQWDPLNILVFHTAIPLILIHSCRGQSEVIGPPQPVVALIGDDVVLPCHLDPVVDALGMTLEWARPDLDPRFVLVWRDGVDLESKKHPLYDRRSSLFTNELKSGNISLKISKVKQSDGGTYRCFVPELDRYTMVQLVVGAASSPVAEKNRIINGVVLQCESAGWYPEPELLWVDGEGNLLSADPTETLRGPDGLYTVSSRVTVEKRHSNNITCRVQQKNISQSRETHIHVPDDFFMVISPSSPPGGPAGNPNIIIGLVIGAVVLLILVLAVFFVLWKRRQQKSKNRTEDKKSMDSKCVEEGESEPLMEGREEETAVDITGERANTSVPDKVTEFKMTKGTHNEEEEEDSDIRGEQSYKDDRETQRVQFVSETEQKSDVCSPQEKRINPSVIIKEDKFTTEEETREEEAVTGRGVKAEGGEGEAEMKMEAEEESGLQFSTRTEKPKEHQLLEREAPSFNFTLSLNTDQEPLRETTTQQERPTESDMNKKQPNAKKQKTKTKKEKKKMKKGSSKFTAQQQENQNRENKLFPVSSEVPERTDLTGQEETPEENKEKEKEEEMRAEPENLRRAESEKGAQEEVTEINEGIIKKMNEMGKMEKGSSGITAQQQENQRTLQTERMDQDKNEAELKTQKNKQDHMEGKKEESIEAEKDLDRDKKQPQFQPETKPETQKVETKDKKNKPAPNNPDRVEGTPGGNKEKGLKGNQNRENKLLPVSSEVPERTDLTVQEETPEENREKEEEMRAQPETLRRAESKKGAQEEVTQINEGIITDGTCRKDEEKEKLQQGKEREPRTEGHLDMDEKPIKEQPEEPVSLSEGGVACQEEPQEELMEVEENNCVDQNHMKERKYTRARVPHTDQQQTGKRKKHQEKHEQQGRSFKRRKEEEENDLMEVEGEDNNQEDVPAESQRKRVKFQPDQEGQESMTHNNLLPVSAELCLADIVMCDLTGS